MRSLRRFDVPFRLVVVAFLWALCFPLIEIAGSSIPLLYLAALRAGVGGAALLACAAVLVPLGVRGAEARLTLVLIGLFATSLGFLGMFRASEFIPPGLATVITDVQPLIASAIAWRVLRERLSVLGWVGLLLGLAGIIVIASPQLVFGRPTDAGVGIAFALLGAGGVAVGYVLMKRLPATLHPMTAMGWQLLIGSVPLGLAAAALEPMPTVGAVRESLGALLGIAIVGTALPFAIWFSVLRTQPIAKVNAYTFLTSIFGLAIGAALFGERLTWLQAAGVALTLLGVHLVQRGALGRAPARAT